MKRESLLGLMLSGATLLAVGGTALAQDALTEPQLRAKLEAQGYTKINDVKFVDGVWKADARSANGDRVDLRIDAKTGEIFPDEQVANLSEADVRAQAGHCRLHQCP